MHTAVQTAVRAAAVASLALLGGCIGYATDSDAPVTPIAISDETSTTTHPGQVRIAVYKVAGDIPAGTTFEQAIADELIIESEIPRDFLPATSVRDLEPLHGTVATEDFSENQVLVEGMFAPLS